MKRFNLGNEIQKKLFMEAVDMYVAIGAVVELKKVKQTRSNRQNAALHLYFEQIAMGLNELGITLKYEGIKGLNMEASWTAENVKNLTFRPLMINLTGKSTTKDLTSEEIDRISQTINQFFADRGIFMVFPSIKNMI